MSRRLARGSGQPLWSQLYDDLTRRLEDGEFTGQFPGELALVEEYDVSRHTVREALRRLRAEGRVTASRGRTSRPAPPGEIEQPLGSMYSLFASVEAAGQAQRSLVRDLRVLTDEAVAEQLGVPAGTPLVYLERLRLAGDQPLALDRAWLPADLAAPLLEADFTATALYDELHRRCGVRLTGGTEHIRAVEVTPAERELLAMPEGVAAFAIERTGVADGRAVEWRETLVRGDRFALRAEFSARDGYRLGVTGPVAPR
jgi:GntR family transcriptional regulator